MSIARPSRHIWRCWQQTARPSTPRCCRPIHSTPIRRKDDGERESSPSQDIARIIEKGRQSQSVDKDEWKTKYDAKQLEAIEAARAVIGDKLEEGNSIQRSDPWSVDYYDDFQKINAVVDQPIRAPYENLDDELRFKTDDEAAAEFEQFIQSQPDDASAVEYIKFMENMRVTKGKSEAEVNPRSALAPTIPSPATRPTKKQGEAEKEPQREPVEPMLMRLMQMTGMNRKQLSKLRVKTLYSTGVVNQTRMGKISSMKCIAIAGNGEGLLGIGEGKSAEDMGNAVMQAQHRAIMSMKPIKLYEKRTIFGTVSGKVGATELELYARPPGFGVRCQGLITEMAEAVGIHDLSARVSRARNPMNTIKATYEALLSQKDPEDIARARGKKLVDVRKVYYAGEV